MARKSRTPGEEPVVPSTARPAHDAVVALTDAFCRDHLDGEYAILCRKLAGALSRKRPSPLSRGKPESWASGIVRAIGWANFLGDPGQPHHMKMADIDKGFGVSEATGSAKSLAIRDWFAIDRLDPAWTLPSRMDDNPLIWMVQVNGMILDIRSCPQEVQIAAFEKGLIPYIPAGRSGGPAGKPPVPRPRGNPDPTRFRAGARVRVKPGIRDPDFADIPLGGWAGVVQEVEHAGGEATYLLTWNQATLDGIHPIYKKRCERDGLILDSMWLGEGDLEPDDGTSVPIERPTAIVTEPLSEKDQDDRVRMALGLTRDDPLPDVTRARLLAYHGHLKARLTFPFPAKPGRGPAITIHRLPELGEYDMDEEYGLFCEARGREGPFDIPLAELGDAGSGNRELVDDYGYWFFNYR